MWSIGCILGEMMCKTLLFPGKNRSYSFVLMQFQLDLNQLGVIMEILGMPSQECMQSMNLNAQQRYMLAPYTSCIKKPWRYCFPTASAQFLDLIDKLLQFDPAKRITATQALKHPFFADFREPEYETTCNFVLDPLLEASLADMQSIRNRVSYETQRCALLSNITAFHYASAKVLQVATTTATTTSNFARMYGMDKEEDEEDENVDLDISMDDE